MTRSHVGGAGRRHRARHQSALGDAGLPLVVGRAAPTDATRAPAWEGGSARRGTLARPTSVRTGWHAAARRSAGTVPSSTSGPVPSALGRKCADRRRTGRTTVLIRV